MPAQYVNIQGGGDADWSQLLNQTQTQAQREHEVAKRMAAQRALLQQMADRGEIKVPDNEVSVGRGGMEFNTEAARKAWVQSQNPQAADLTKRDGVNTTTAEELATAPELIKDTNVAGIQRKLNPNYEQMSDLALIQAQATVQQTLDQQADPNAAWARGAGTGMTQPNPKPNLDAATNALGTIMGMNRQPSTSGVQTPLKPAAGGDSTPGSQGGSTQQAVPPSYNETARVATGNKEVRAGRDAVKIVSTPVNFDLEADPMIKTRSEKTGYNMIDEVQETLPSLRKAAAIESISAMFGGTNVQSPGRFNALAEQREKDLANVNSQLAQNSIVEGITGGKVKAKTSGGNIGMDVSGFGSSASQINVKTDVKAGNGGSTGGGDQPDVVTFQGEGGANVEGYKKLKNGVEYVTGLNNKIALFKLPTKVPDGKGGFRSAEGSDVISSFMSATDPLVNRGFKVSIPKDGDKNEAGDVQRVVKVNGQPSFTIEYTRATNSWAIAPIAGTDIPVPVITALSKNEKISDNATRDEVGKRIEKGIK